MLNNKQTHHPGTHDYSTITKSYWSTVNRVHSHRYWFDHGRMLKRQVVRYWVNNMFRHH